MNAQEREMKLRELYGRHHRAAEQHKEGLRMFTEAAEILQRIEKEVLALLLDAVQKGEF